jgi:hypothetical protein
MAKPTKPDDRGEGPVSDAELAEIARHLREVLGETGHAFGPPPRPAEDRHGRTATPMLRFAGSFVVPGLILIAVILARGLGS